MQHLAGSVEHLHRTGRLDLERLVVAAVLFGRLRHEADVGHRSDRGGVEWAVGVHVVDDRLEHPGVRRVGDDRERVVLATVDAPQLAAVADERGHRCVHDHVGGDVQVRQALVGVRVREAGAALVRRGESGRDLVAVRDAAEPRENRAEPVVGRQALLGDHVAVGVEHVGVVGLHDVAEDDRVADLHHRGLQVHRVQDVFGLGGLERLGEEGVQRRSRQERRVDDLAGQNLQAGLELRHGAVRGDVLDREHVIARDDDRLLVRLEVVVAHRRDPGLRPRRERLVAVRVLARVVLHRERGTAIAVALAQDGVDRRTLDAVVPGADVLLLERLRVVRVIRDVEALALQFGDGALELRDRCRDVRELDDVRLGKRGQPTELGEGIAHLLLGRQLLGKRRQNAPRERDVTRLDIHPCLAGDRLHDREERRGRQRRSLVGVGVDDGRISHRLCLRSGGLSSLSQRQSILTSR